MKVSKNMADPSPNNPNLILAILLGFLGYYGISRCLLDWGCMSAFVWPAYETFPWFERRLDPTFAVNDFWLNSFMPLQAKQIFAYFILSVQKVSGYEHYYSAFFLVKLILSTCYIPIVYAAMISLIPVKLKNKVGYWAVHLVIAALTLIAGSPKVWNFVTVALWPPLKFDVVPSNFSQMIGFLAIYLNSSRQTKKISYVLFLLSVTCHVGIGTFIIIFNYVCRSFDVKSKWREVALVFLLCCVLPGLIISSLNYSGSLPASVVYETVVKNFAPFHWKFADLETFVPGQPWSSIAVKMSFTLGIFLLISLALGKRGRQLTAISAASLLTYLGSFLFHYIFTEIFLTKVAIYFASIRYNLFGYWMIVLCFGSLIAIAFNWNRESVMQSASSRSEFSILNFTFNSPRNASPFLGLIAIAVCLAILLRPRLEDHPLQNPQHWEVVNWAKGESSEAVIFSSDQFTTDILLFARRSTYLFLNPFNESALYEWYDRHQVIWGNYEDWQKISGAYFFERKMKNFTAMTPEKLVVASMKDRIDFFVLKSDGLMVLNPAFDDLKPTRQLADGTRIWTSGDLKQQVCSKKPQDFCSQNLATKINIDDHLKM